VVNYLLDPGTFLGWDDGHPESVVTGEGLVDGHRVAVMASDFGFAGGSIGLVAGERLTRAVERATAERLPLIALPASGGTRMQEGTAAFLQMLKVTAAVTAHKAAGLPYLVYLRHPTTGGVLASWASLGHITLAEPGALVGFLGPRVYEALEGRPFPAGIQTAEHLHRCGIIDAVISPSSLHDYIARVLAGVMSRVGLAARWSDGGPAGLTGDGSDKGPGGQAGRAGDDGGLPAGDLDAWECVRLTRRAGRARAGDLLRVVAADVVTVRAAGGLRLALGRVAGEPVVLTVQEGAGPFGIEGLDLALRGMTLAAGLRRPLVTVVDTPGAELSVAAEESGIAGRIARCMEALVGLPVPTVSVLLGQGTGGGALALLPADRVLAASRGWLAPLAPEGASAIVYRDTAHTAEMARAQGITAADLARAGLVDQVVPEEGDWLAGVADALRLELADLTAMDEEMRLAQRRGRIRALGA
jgi:acetyl-CoA carboxylase carboxyl transferase subunit beta